MAPIFGNARLPLWPTYLGAVAVTVNRAAPLR